MAQDITEQANQDAIADSLVAEPEESQEPQEPTGTEETVEETEPPAEQAEEQVEEEADYLPTEQEKVFPDEVLAKYAQRYGIDFAKADPQTRQLVIDKINSDIYVRQLREQAEQEPEQVVEERAAGRRRPGRRGRSRRRLPRARAADRRGRIGSGKRRDAGRGRRRNRAA